MGKKKEGKEILQCFVYRRMAEGKFSRNLNDVLNTEFSNEEIYNEWLVEWRRVHFVTNRSYLSIHLHCMRLIDHMDRDA